MDLKDGLMLDMFHSTAFVGAGGKTTAVFLLARELDRPVWVTASVHLAVEQTRLGDRHIILNNVLDIPDEILPGITVFTGPFQEDDRTAGLSFEILEKVNNIAGQLDVPLLIEADGSRRKPLKAPADHEPAIPPFVDQVVVLVGMSGFGKPLENGSVHRPERFAALSDLQIDQPVTPDGVQKALLAEQGGLKNIPLTARRVVLFNQVDTPEQAGMVKSMAANLLPQFHAVIAAHLKKESVLAVHQQVAGVVLAGGGSVRFGQPKQFLDWKGESFVRAVTKTALTAGLYPVLVVTGAYQNEVENALEGLEVRLVHNPDWEEGQSASVKAGLAALSDHLGPVVFLLVDQPQISPSLVEKLVAAHAETLSPIVAPMVDGRRGNPVLFDRRTFADFAQIEGDAGGRQIFSKYRVEWITWLDPAASLDVDTPEDYARLLKYQD